ncbi:hypothetical protein N6H14_07560 [Paenibacillus sp. CC-CFT747]|nr:hypothetical protein N6H14_07560 [Paenibacillus sp. CC-CFT747]
MNPSKMLLAAALLAVWTAGCSTLELASEGPLEVPPAVAAPSPSAPAPTAVASASPAAPAPDASAEPVPAASPGVTPARAVPPAAATPGASPVAVTPVPPATAAPAPSGTPAGEPSAKPAEPTPVQAPAVRISLDSEPRLAAPTEQGSSVLGTLVTYAPQSYTLAFREPMDRRSVEKQLTEQTAEAGVPSVKPQLTFEWQSDTLLKVHAEVEEAPKPGYSSDRYTLNANGALTARGEKLADAAKFHAILHVPEQVWTMNTRTKVAKRVSSSGEPYFYQSLGSPPGTCWPCASRITANAMPICRGCTAFTIPGSRSCGNLPLSLRSAIPETEN